MTKHGAFGELVLAVGHEAIELADRDGRKLSKYADPTEGARTGLSVDEARAVAHEDPGLVYLAVRGELIWFAVGNVAEHSGFVTVRRSSEAWTSENESGWTYQSVTGAHGTVLDECEDEPAARAILDKWLECDDDRCYSHGTAAGKS